MTGLVYPGLLALVVAGLLGFGLAFLLKSRHKLTRMGVALGSLGVTVFAGGVALSYAGIVDLFYTDPISFGTISVNPGYGFGGLPQLAYTLPLWIAYGLWATALGLVVARLLLVILVEHRPRRSWSRRAASGHQNTEVPAGNVVR